MMTNSSGTNDPEVREQLVSLGHFARRCFRFWGWLLGALLLACAAFAVFLHFHAARYRSETVILYVEKGDTSQEVESSDVQRNVTVRLKELLYARPNLERVVQRFDLYPELRSRYGMVDAVEELKKHVDFRAPGGDTFSIGFEGSSANEAQAVTATLAQMVIDGDAELRKNQAKVALDFLVGERQTRDAELKRAEQELAAFMAQHPRFALDATPLANGAAIRATMNGAVSHPTAGYVPRVPRPLPTGPASDVAAKPVSAPLAGPDPEEARARAALAAARETLTQKLERYTPAHPDVRAAEAAVQRATERLAAITSGATTAPAATPPPAGPAKVEPAPSVAAAPRPLPPRFQPAAPTPAAAASASGARTDTLVELETDWLRLTRAVTEARQRLDQIEAQLFRADIEVSSENGGHAVQVNVIDPAFLPQRPVPPGRATLGLVFLAGGLLLGLVAMIAKAILDDRVFDARDVGSVLDVLAEVPRGHERRQHAAG